MRWLFALGVTALSVSSFAQNKSMTVLAIEYPPFVTQHESGLGISTQFLSQRLEAAGWGKEVKFLPPGRAFIESQKNDWLLSFYPPRGDIKAAAIVLGDAQINYGLFRRAQPGAFKWQSLNELKGKTVATIRSQTSTANEDSNNLTEAGLEMTYVDSLQQGILMLDNGRVDYLLTTDATGWYYIEKNNLDPANFQFTENPFRAYPHMIYVNLNHPDAQRLLQDLQRENEHSAPSDDMAPLNQNLNLLR